ncbi:MAG TPA: protein kinase [Pirellulales bacterium]|nr:protein kinase [Pirellulales bacterium]
MNNLQPTCDPRHIEGCLNDSLSDEERSAFEAHLEVCPACRAALELSAGQPDDWQRIRTFLSSDPALPLHGAQLHRAHSGSLSSGEVGHNRADLHSTDSEAVEDAQREAVDSVLSHLAPTDDPRMLGRLGGYEIAGVVGRGGMGVVLKALDPALNRYVAIKVLAPQLATSGAARQRFAREARAAASVVHENVVAIHGVADSGPLPYFVMPYLRGSSLQKRLDAHGPLGTSEILRVAVQIAAGLSAAHAQGLVHRDIKPANIMLEDGVERLKITDFGLARAADDASLTRTGIIAGTPQFMSPEQARGELVDSRSDLFSLGSVMYAMCTGRLPFRAETSYGTLQRICDAQPQSISEINPEIPSWLVAVIGQLHEKNPDARFQTAQEVTHLLEQCLAHLRQPDVVPLPAAVINLIEQSKRTPTRRAAGHYAFHLRRAASFLLSDRIRAVSVATATCAAVAFVTAIAIRWWPSTETAVSPAAPSSVANTPGSAATVPEYADEPINRQPGSAGPFRPIFVTPSAIWNDDGIASELNQLQSDISRLESRLEDHPPTPEKTRQERKP